MLNQAPAISPKPSNRPLIQRSPAQIKNIPRPDDLLILFLASFALRLLITFATLRQTGLSLNQFAHLYDGNSYLITAQSILGQTTQFNDYHGRVFYGLPMLLALLARAGIPMHLSALLINWIAASLAPVLAAKLFNDLRVGYATSFLFPHTLMNSCLAMTESPMLALTLGGLLLMRIELSKPSSSRPLFAGTLFGLAMVFRPMACFALIAIAVYEFFTRHLKSTLLLIASSFTIIAVAMLLQGHWRGDILANVRYQATSPNAYSGRLLTFPFLSLLTVPFKTHAHPAKVIYLWIHALILFAACACAAREVFHRPVDRSEKQKWLAPIAALWLAGNTLFLLCLGSPFGFECFHRFSIPAAPAMWWFLRNRLPTSKWLRLPIAIASATIAVLTIASDHPALAMAR